MILITKHRFIPIPLHIAELTQRLSSPSPAERRSLLQRSRESYERYLNLLDSYGMLDALDQKMYEGYVADPRTFSVVGGSGGDPGRRREEKIRGFKRERDLRGRVEVCSFSSGDLGVDLVELKYSTSLCHSLLRIM